MYERAGLSAGDAYQHLKWVRGQAALLFKLVEDRCLHLIDHMYFPRFLALENTDGELKEFGRKSTEQVIHALRRLYADRRMRHFYFKDVLWQMKSLYPTASQESVNFGLFMCSDFETMTEYWRLEPAPQTEGYWVTSITVRDSILGYKSLEVAWHEEQKLRPIKSKKTELPKSALSKGAAESSNFPFISNAQLRKIIVRDYLELQKTKGAGAIKSRLILVGGLIEAMLLDVLQQNEAKATASPLADKRPLDQWSLETLIDVAVGLSLISKGAHQVGHAVREFRNLVHPAKEMKGDYQIAEEEARIAEEILSLIIRDLKARTSKKE